MSRLVLLLGAAVLLGACSGAAISGATEGAPAIPTFKPLPSGGCPAALLAAVTLRGDAAKSGTPVWVEDPSGHAYTIEWPNGYTARFDPGLTVFDAKGAVVARVGDVLDLGGGQMSDGYDWFACSISHHGNP
jgi:hypothetical protein